MDPEYSAYIAYACGLMIATVFVAPACILRRRHAHPDNTAPQLALALAVVGSCAAITTG